MSDAGEPTKPPARGRTRREETITREMARANPGTLFVFGDNMAQVGFGGHAGAMRGEPNAVGIPTRWSPERTLDAFFIDSDLHNSDVRAAIDGAFDRLEAALDAGCDVVIPREGIASGPADLPRRAPTIAAHIVRRLAALEAFE